MIQETPPLSLLFTLLSSHLKAASNLTQSLVVVGHSNSNLLSDLPQGSAKQLLEDLDKARHCFLWATDNEISGVKCKVGWTFVAKPVQFSSVV